ncbi:MAG: hypothetical protein V3U76_20320 [Granulosicoccus sp.]
MRAIFKSIAIVVGIPSLLATIYFGFFASDIYVSESRFSIRSVNASPVTAGLAALLASPIGGGGGPDSIVVSDYVHSQDMLSQVQEKLDFRAHYSDNTVDHLSRLNEHATQEETLEYFRKRVDIIRDSSSGVFILRVRAYDATMAQSLAKLVIELSERLVNNLSIRMEEDALSTARNELQLAANKVRTASDVLTSFRNINASLNPAAESSALLGIVAGIETKLVEARAALSEKLAYMREDAAEIITLKNRINALQRQFRLEKSRVVGAEDGQGLSRLIENYQPLVLEQEIAQQQYASALTSLELARIEAQRQKQYLVTFVQPSLPDEAVEPRRIAKILTVMVFSFLLYLIGGLMWSALKDHIGR